MPAPIFTRPSRDYQFVPGIGSNLVVRQYDAAGNITPPLSQAGTILDIEQGFIRPLFRNRNTTNSGSNGADLYTRVGAGWRFALVLSFPALVDLVEVDNVNAGNALITAFVEELLGSRRSVHLQFNVGDPQYWSTQDLPQRSYRAAKALLDDSSEIRFDSTGTEVIGMNLVGVGNSLLWNYLDDTRQSPLA